MTLLNVVSPSDRVSPLEADPESSNINSVTSDDLKQPINDSQLEENPNVPLLAVSTKKSSITSQDICRICHCEGEHDAPLVAPCCCSGSLKYVHQSCLQRWVQSSDVRNCELCKFPFVMQTKIKPFKEWEKLDMSSMERRKLACSVTFHAVAFTCVIWSLYVLIDRSAEEYYAGQLQWPFWTKLVVVAIGFTGGVVFMYVQCAMYLTLCRRWRAYNRVIMVQSLPNPSTVSLVSESSAIRSGTKRKKGTSTGMASQKVITNKSISAGSGRGNSDSSALISADVVCEPRSANADQPSTSRQSDDSIIIPSV